MQKFASTLRFSNYFALIQFTLLAGSIISVCLLPFSGFTKAILISGLLVYSLWIFYSYIQWHGIGQDIEGWYLQKAGVKIPIVISGDSTITSVVSILRFTQEGRSLKQSCIIFNDALPIDIYRQFIVRVKYFK